MCGISCIVSQNNSPIERQSIGAMNDAILHRGPDGCGYFFGPNFAFGHRRLAILDISPAGHQPMEYLDRYVICYNGEVYNYLELREELKKVGFVFKSTCDTEVILAAYAKWGEDCVRHFNGMWAFALFDKIKNVIFYSRDRFGVKPLYYSVLGTYFACASEIKQFIVLDGWKASLNQARAHDFLVHGIFDHTEETLFSGVFQLRGGHNLIYDLNRHDFEIKRWYNLEKESSLLQQIDFPAAAAMFRKLLEDSVKLRLRSDVKVGSCLSGGLDSSSIVCIANDLLRRQNAHDKQETVSSCFSIKRYDEQQYIDEVIKKTKAVSHRVYPRFEELPQMLDRLIWHQDEPFGSTSMFAQWNVFECARENGLIVMLDGQGADEELAGYHSFYRPFFQHLWRSLHWCRLFHEIISYTRLHKSTLTQSVKDLVYTVLPLDTFSFLKWRVGKESISRYFSFSSDIHTACCLEKHASLNHFSYSQLLNTNLPMLLHYEDRNSMAHSIESRVPFLDYRLVEFALSLKDDFKIRDGKTKYVLREAMKETLPRKIYARNDKMGFVTPEETWFKEHKKWFISEIESTIELSNGMISEKIHDLVKGILLGSKQYDSAIWRTIAFGRWLNLFKIET